MINLDITGDDNAVYRVLNCFGNEALVLRMSLFNVQKIAPTKTEYCKDETHTININGVETLNYNGSSLDVALENYYNLLTPEAKAAIISMPVIQDVWEQTSSTNYDVQLVGLYYKKVGENYIGNRHVSALSLTQLIEYFDSTQPISEADFDIATANLTSGSQYSVVYPQQGPLTWISTLNQNLILYSTCKRGVGTPGPANFGMTYPALVFTIDLSKINYTINTTPVGNMV